MDDSDEIFNSLLDQISKKDPPPFEKQRKSIQKSNQADNHIEQDDDKQHFQVNEVVDVDPDDDDEIQQSLDYFDDIFNDSTNEVFQQRRPKTTQPKIKRRRRLNNNEDKQEDSSQQESRGFNEGFEVKNPQKISKQRLKKKRAQLFGLSGLHNHQKVQQSMKLQENRPKTTEPLTYFKQKEEEDTFPFVNWMKSRQMGQKGQENLKQSVKVVKLKKPSSQVTKTINEDLVMDSDDIFRDLGMSSLLLDQSSKTIEVSQEESMMGSNPKEEEEENPRSSSFKKDQKKDVKEPLEQEIIVETDEKQEERAEKEDYLPKGVLDKFMRAERDNYEKLLQFEKEQNKKLEDHYNESTKREQQRNADYIKMLEDSHMKERNLLKKKIEETEISAREMVTREKQLIQKDCDQQLKQQQLRHENELRKQEQFLLNQNETLKKQLQQQIKLAALSEDLKLNSNKLTDISERLQVHPGKYSRDAYSRDPNQISAERELEFEQKEARIEAEKLRLDDEKKRIRELNIELDSREINSKKAVEKEREILRQEYKRLYQLQDEIKKIETEKRKDIEAERERLNELQRLTQKEKDQNEEDFKRKSQQTQQKLELYEQQRKSFLEQIEKRENVLRLKSEQYEMKRHQLSMQQTEMTRIQKNLEMKEFQLMKDLDEYKANVERFYIEQKDFHREKQFLNDLSSNVKKESEKIQDFRNRQNQENEKLHQIKLKLDNRQNDIRIKEINVKSEKQRLGALQRTLENFRHDYVKSMDQNAQQMRKPILDDYLTENQKMMNILFPEEGESMMMRKDVFNSSLQTFDLKSSSKLKQWQNDHQSEKKITPPRNLLNKKKRFRRRVKPQYDRKMIFRSHTNYKENRDQNWPNARNRSFSLRKSTFSLQKRRRRQRRRNSFNLNDYMDSLKDIQSQVSTNTQYLENEQEEIKNKIFELDFLKFTKKYRHRQQRNLKNMSQNKAF